MGFLTDASPALLCSIAAVCVVIGLPTLLWSLFADRARGRKRCPRCWYDMDGAPGLRCSECGHAAIRPEDLLRSRRRWAWALVSCIPLFGGTALILTPTLREHGPLALVPNGILVHFAPTTAEELRRDSSAQTWTWHPVGVELARRMKQQALSPAQLRTALERSGAIQYRDRWPEHERFMMGVTLPRWLGRSSVELTPRRRDFGVVGAEFELATCGNSVAMRRQYEQCQYVGMLQPGENIITFDGVVVTFDFWGTPTTVKLPPWEIHVQTVPTWADVFPPSSPAFAVSASLSPAVRGDESRLSFDIIIDGLPASSRESWPRLRFLAELLKDGTRHAIGEIVYPLRRNVEGIAACVTFEVRRAAVLADAPESWTLNLIPDARELALAWDLSVDPRPIKIRVVDCVDASIPITASSGPQRLSPAP